MALQTTKRMILPVVDETFQEHFDDRTWLSPQDQVDAGYPIFIQPTNPTAQFVYIHDVGTIITQQCLVAVDVPMDQVVSTVTVAAELSFSTDGVTYDSPTNGLQRFTGNFRYVKVQLDFEADDDHELAIVGPVRLRVTLKRKRDSGSGTSSATLPTTVTFNQTFIDVRSITVTAAYNASYPKGVTAVYDFTDTPYPTEFDVYCFDNDTGDQVANDFSWAAEGV